MNVPKVTPKSVVKDTNSGVFVILNASSKNKLYLRYLAITAPERSKTTFVLYKRKEL